MAFAALQNVHLPWPQRFELLSSLSGRTFANEDGDDPSRVGGPTNSLLDGPEDFSTMISFRDNHTGISKTLQRASRTVNAKSANTSLALAFEEMQNMADVVGANRNVVDTAKQLYKRADEEKIFRGSRFMQAHIAACIFVACRINRTPRTFKEFVHVTGVHDKTFINTVKLLKQKFEGTSVAALAGGQPAAAGGGGGAPDSLSADQIAASAEDIVVRFCSYLALPANVQTAACEVVRKVTNLGTLTGRSPITVATSCIYFTSALLGQPKTAQEIASVGGIAEGTVKFAYKSVSSMSSEAGHTVQLTLFFTFRF